VTPRVVVLAATSGGGKTTIANELRRRLMVAFVGRAIRPYVG